MQSDNLGMRMCSMCMFACWLYPSLMTEDRGTADPVRRCMHRCWGYFRDRELLAGRDCTGYSVYSSMQPDAATADTNCKFDAQGIPCDEEILLPVLKDLLVEEFGATTK